MSPCSPRLLLLLCWLGTLAVSRGRPPLSVCLCVRKYVSAAEFSTTELTAIRFEFLDRRGGDDLERPPNGHPTAAALQRCRTLIPQALREVVLQRAGKMRVWAVMFGQGLIEQATAPPAARRRSSPDSRVVW